MASSAKTYRKRTARRICSVALFRAARKRLIASAIAVGYGGPGAALAKKAIAGGFGIDADLSHIDLPDSKKLYSESTGRILVTVAPQNKEKFEKEFKKFGALRHIGHIAQSDILSINGILDADIVALEQAYKAPLKDY